MSAIEVFCSYAPNDEMWLRQLETHLSGLKRQGLISFWHNRKILPGSNWAETIGTHLETSSIILLLISADFVASDYCYGTEMKRALELHRANKARVIPIVVRPCDWQQLPFGKLQALPMNAKPISIWEFLDEGWTEVTVGLRCVIEDLSVLSVSASRSLLPSVWMVPYPRNFFFTGQKGLLDRLSTALNKGQTIALSQPQAISGLGGIGKTQIAVEYAYRSQQDYQTVFWGQADSSEALLSGYTAMAKELNLPQKDQQDQTFIVHAVLQWLKTHTRWLLVLDNVDDLTVLRKFLPPAPSGHILLTTRAQTMGGLAQLIEVDPMEVDTGILFLLRRTGLLDKDAPLEAALPDDVTTARKIVEDLGGLPLALDQAGAYIEDTQCNLVDYQSLYRSHRAELLKERGSLDDHPDSVTTTLSLSFQKVEQKSPIAIELLRCCTFLHPDAIPEEIITVGARYLGPLLQNVAHDPLALNAAIIVLRTYSLIRRDRATSTLNMHRLVQAVLRDAMTLEIARMWTVRIVRAINTAFPKVKFITWPQCEQYLPHIQICVGLLEESRTAFPDAACLFIRAGQYLLERARYGEAERLLRQGEIFDQQSGGYYALESLNALGLLYRFQSKLVEAQSLLQQALFLNKTLFGSDTLETAVSMNNLANLYQQQGKDEEAESLFQRSLEIHEKLLGAKHPDTARGLNNLAEIYRVRGKYEEAELLHLRALSIYEQLMETEHPDATRVLNNLGLLYASQERYAEAEPFYLRALAIREQHLGADHPDTARCLMNLAGLYRDQGRYEESESSYLRVLPIYEQWLGTEHYETAVLLVNFAFLYTSQERYAEAEPLLLRALATREQHLGLDHPDTVSCIIGLASLYMLQARHKEAESLVRRVLAIKEQLLGASHPDTVAIWNMLADVYQMQERYEEAEQLYLCAFSILEQHLGAEHPDITSILNRWASLYHRQKKAEKAAPLLALRQIIKEWRQSRADPPDILQGFAMFAYTYQEEGKYEEAEQACLYALAIGEQRVGSEHPDTADRLNDLVTLYKRQERYEEAEPLLLRALAIREQQLGLDHPDTATSLNRLGHLYSCQQKYGEAEIFYQRALAIREQQLGADHPDTTRSLNNLAVLYQDQGKYEEAEAFYQRVLVIHEQLGAENDETDLIFHNLATFYMKQGKYEQAEPLLRRTLVAMEKRWGPEHPNIVQGLNNLAFLCDHHSKYEEAEMLYQRALAIAEKLLGSRHSLTQITRKNYAGLLRNQGHDEEAKQLEESL